MQRPLQYSKEPLRKKVDVFRILFFIVVGICFVLTITCIILLGKIKSLKDNQESYQPITEIATPSEPDNTNDITETETNTQDLTSETESTTESTTEETTEILKEDDSELEASRKKYSKTIEYMCSAYNERDLEKVVNVYLPCVREVTKTGLLDSVKAKDEASFWKIMKKNYGKDFKLTCKKLDARDMSDEEILSVKKALEQYNFEGDIKKAVSYHVKETYSGSTSSFDKEEYLVFVKTDEKWYLVGKTSK